MTSDSDKSFDPRTWTGGASKDDKHKTAADFDPRTWVDAETADDGIADTAKEAGADPGFDPRTWVGPLDTDTLPLPKRRKTGGNRPAALAIGGAAAILAVAGGGYWVVRPAPPPPGTAVPKAQVKPPPRPKGGARIVQVAGVGGMLRALLDMGIPPEEAIILSNDVAAALGSTEEPIRLEVELREAPGGAETGVASLLATLSGGQGVSLTRLAGGGFERTDLFARASTTIRRIEGRMGEESFYVDAVGAGMPDSLITPFAKAFSFDFDFQRDVSTGDRFEAVWEEQLAADGRAAAPPKLLYAALETTKGRREYYAFTPPDELEERWFDLQGQGAQRGLMRTPVDGARVSSRFGYRTHPIYQTAKAHNGIDFAAPTGTPIYASGNAKVVFRAFSGTERSGAGNLIKLQHDDGEDMQTWYMHLSRFADGLEVGQTVRQGEIIGYVGSTGGSTGPHLHYEIRLAGKPTDPLTYETTQVAPLAGEALRMFMQRRAEIDELRRNR